MSTCRPICYRQSNVEKKNQYAEEQLMEMHKKLKHVIRIFGNTDLNGIM